jgi:hypothetical protein
MRRNKGGNDEYFERFDGGFGHSFDFGNPKKRGFLWLSDD